MQLRPINEQVVVLMGASSGIGKEAALEFARQGAKLVVSARNEEGLNELVRQATEMGAEAIAIGCDTSKPEQIQEVVRQAVEHFGGSTLGVQVAGVGAWAEFEKITPDEFRQIVEVNLLGQAFAAMAALPELKRNGGGAFIGISSIEGMRALPLQTAYAASKHGVVGFLESLRMELEHEGAPVSVTNIMPATINTPFFSSALTKLGVKPKGMPPVYQPEVVAQAILYAAANPVRDLYAGGAGKAFILGQKLMPRVMDKYLMATGFRQQRTDEAKGPDAPNNLTNPKTGETRVHGDFSEQAKPVSAYTWLETHPKARTAIMGTLLGVAGAVLARQMRKPPQGALQKVASRVKSLR